MVASAFYTTLFAAPATLTAGSRLTVTGTGQGAGAFVADATELGAGFEAARQAARSSDAYALSPSPFGNSATDRSVAYHPATIFARDTSVPRNEREALDGAPDVAELSARAFLEGARPSPAEARDAPIGGIKRSGDEAPRTSDLRYEAAKGGAKKGGDGAESGGPVPGARTRTSRPPARPPRPLKPLTYLGFELPARPDGGAVVLARDALTMSDIPELAGEFQRLRRDELLILHFLDVFHPIAQQYRGYHAVPRKERELLAGELERAGLDACDPRSVRVFLSAALRFSALRHQEDAFYAPHDLLCPLIACYGAGLVHLDLGVREAESWCCDLSQVIPHIDRVSHRSPAEKSALARAMYGVAKIFRGTRPLFHRDDRRYAPLVVMARECLMELPATFLAGPSRFIERQKDAQEGEAFALARKFFHLNLNPYDTTRIKRFRLGKVPIISKRVEALRVHAIEQEIGRAREVEDAVRAAGIANVRTVEYLGLVYDAGNFYLLMRDERAPSLREVSADMGDAVFENVREALVELHQDLKPRNALWNGRELILLDFEEHSTIVSVDHFPPASDAIVHARLSRARSVGDLRGLPADDPVIGRFRTALKLAEPRSLRGLPETAVIGDIHGNDGRLSQLLASDPARQAARTIFLGDYFDRGKGGQAVFELLKKRPAKKNVFLLGNHELSFLLAMRGDRASFLSWLGNGALDFLNELVDLGSFKEAFGRACAALPEGIASELVDWIAREEPEVIEALERDVLANAVLREIRDWLLTVGRLSFLDEYGHLYVHAGLTGVEGLGPDFFLKHARAEQSFREAMRPGSAVAPEEALALAKEFRSILEVRDTEWMHQFPPNDWRRTLEAILRLGIRGIVVGHNPRPRAMHQMNRLFGIDLQMAEIYGNRGGLLRLSPKSGVAVHRFDDGESSRLVAEEILTGQEFREDLRMDGEELVREFQRYFLKRIP